LFEHSHWGYHASPRLGTARVVNTQCIQTTEKAPTHTVLLLLCCLQLYIHLIAQPGHNASVAMLDWRLVGLLAGLQGNQSALVVQAKRSIPSCSPDSINWFGEWHIFCGIGQVLTPEGLHADLPGSD
jgi:hypothetical protein